MHLIEVLTGKKYPVSIELISQLDLKKITKKRYSFNWRTEKEQTIYKIILEGQTDILGLMSIEYYESESRIHVRLLAVSIENKGKGKLYERIAGTLLAFAARDAIKLFDAKAAISLTPKTNLRQHYMDEYGFEQAGISLFMEGKNLQKLLKTYHYD